MIKLNETLPTRFFAKVEKTDYCWIWHGNKTNDGYGLIHPGSGSQKALAHRISYQMHNGFLPDSLIVMHICDNPRCVNPEHLVMGTHRDNVADMINKGRCDRICKPRKLMEAAKDEILEMRRNGMSVNRLAVTLGVTKRAMSKFLKDQGVYENLVDAPAKKVEDFYDLVLERRRQGTTLREIGEEIGVDKRVIANALKKRGDYKPMKPGPKTNHATPIS